MSLDKIAKKNCLHFRSFPAQNTISLSSQCFSDSFRSFHLRKKKTKPDLKHKVQKRNKEKKKENKFQFIQSFPTLNSKSNLPQPS